MRHVHLHNFWVSSLLVNKTMLYLKSARSLKPTLICFVTTGRPINFTQVGLCDLINFVIPTHLIISGQQWIAVYHWAITLCSPASLLWLQTPLTCIGQAQSCRRLTSIMHILQSDTDNCPFWISGRQRIIEESILWSIFTRKCCWSGQDRTHNLLITSRRRIQLS